MSIPYQYQLRHDPQGRIIGKTETVAGKSSVWTYAYDKAGRLTEAKLCGRLICQSHYDKQGRRSQDSFPRRTGHAVSNYRYTVDNRLQSAGNNGYTHDKNGFRLLWNCKGMYTRYEYAPDYRLLKTEEESTGRVFEFYHDENGQREGKFLNGEMVETCAWLDFVRLAAYYDGQNVYDFSYEEGSRSPYAMRRDDGAVAYLFYDQVGSLRVVADTSGNVIQEILYDPFGGIIEDTNPGLHVPIGFAGGLHDRDLGFVRFGWRDYDTFTGRWTAPDPMGDAGGDRDWYGYCLDDPINGVDPLGLFQFGKKPLSFLPDSWHWIGTNGSTADKGNNELKHEQGFYEDGTGDNMGFSKDGMMTKEDKVKYQLDDTHFDDSRMRQAEKSLEPGEYKLLKWGGKSNNCQDYADNLRDRYRFLRSAEKH